MKKLDSAGWTIWVLKLQKVEFDGDVQEHRDDLKRPEWIEQLTFFFVFTSAKASRLFGRRCQVRRGEIFQVCKGVRSQRALLKRNLFSPLEKCLLPSGCRDDRPIVDSGSVVSTWSVRTVGFDIMYERGAYVLDVDVNDGVYVNDKNRKIENDSGIRFPVIRKRILGESLEPSTARS